MTQINKKVKKATCFTEGIIYDIIPTYINNNIQSEKLRS